MDQNQPPQVPQPPTPPPTGSAPTDKLSVPLVILSFCIPIAGAIIWLIKKDKEPASAKTACTAAIIGFIVGIIGNLIYTLGNR